MKKWIVYLVGMNLIAIAIVLNIRWNMGVTAFSTLPYASSEIFSLSLGTASIIVYLILVVLQCILKRKITLEFLLEIPVSFLFGFFNDFYDALIPDVSLSFTLRIIFFILTMFITALGVYMSVQSTLPLTPVDGTVKTISQVFEFKFSLVKNGFDASMVIFTIVLCLLTGNTFIGIGIGTIITALLTGRVISIYERCLPINI